MVLPCQSSYNFSYTCRVIDSFVFLDTGQRKNKKQKKKNVAASANGHDGGRVTDVFVTLQQAQIDMDMMVDASLM